MLNFEYWSCQDIASHVTEASIVRLRIANQNEMDCQPPKSAHQPPRLCTITPWGGGGCVASGVVIVHIPFRGRFLLTRGGGVT